MSTNSKDMLYYRVRDGSSAQQLFKNIVFDITIETSSYCNRRCFYCPNSLHDRISKQVLLDSELFERLVGDLGSIDYSRRIQLGYYNEPLADPTIVDKVGRLRSALPGAFISIFSNGDYADEELLARLRAAGLNELSISLHTGNTKP